MSKYTEKENISKIKEMIGQIDELNKQKAAVRGEIDKLLLKRYPTSSRDDIRLFKSTLDIGMWHTEYLEKAKSMIADDRFVHKI